MKRKFIIFISLVIVTFIFTGVCVYGNTQEVDIKTRVFANDTIISENENLFKNTDTIVVSISANNSSTLKFSRATLNTTTIQPSEKNGQTIKIELQPNQFKTDKTNVLSVYYVGELHNTTIVDSETPLAMPDNKHLAILNFIFGIATIALGVTTLLVHDQTQELYKFNKHYRRILIGVSISMSVFSSFFFLGTNDLFSPRQLYDQWTPLMFIFFVDQLTMTIINYKITRAEG